MSSRTTAPARPSQSVAGGRPPVALIIVSAVAVLAVVVAAVLLARGGGSGDTTAAAPPMAHVHGLGVDPADGQLVAGTHVGAFRVGDGSAEQVGPQQDFMGFTVVGPNHYLASGHPGAGQDAPGNLGLIESTDGGRTWSTLSLSGEADFHSLEARHGRVYGYSGGQLMVSEDKRSWQLLAGLPLADFAVSPDDAQRLLATTERGLAVSEDGGRTFAPVDGAPVLVLLAWTDEGALVGVDPAGVVHASLDSGSTWERRGTVKGQPAALTAVGDDVYVATVDGRILESADGGRAFTTRYAEA